MYVGRGALFLLKNHVKMQKIIKYKLPLKIQDRRNEIRGIGTVVFVFGGLNHLTVFTHNF